MPAQRTQSVLTAKFGNRVAQAAAKGAATPIEYGGQRNLPAGIKNGIAQLTDCKFVKFEANTNQKQADGSSAVGQVYLSIRGVIHEPEVFGPNNTRVRGLQVGFMVPICDRGVKWGQGNLNFDQCIKRAQDMMRVVGGDGLDYADMEGAAATIEDAKPFFTFETRASKPDPKTGDYRVFEDLTGSAPDYGGDSDVAGGDVADSTGGGATGETSEHGSADQFNEYETGGGEAADVPADAEGNEDGTTGEATDAAEVEPGSDEELTVLVEQAGTEEEVEEGSTEEAARMRLNELATEAGATDEELSATTNWQETADLIRTKRQEAEAAAAEPEPEPEPPPAPKPTTKKPPTKPAATAKGTKPPATKPLKVGDVRKIKLAGAKAAFDVSILSLAADGTCTLKSLATGKPITNKLKKVEKFKVSDLLPV